MTINNGDLVTYERCFGDSVCTFVGIAEQLEYDNDCVLIYNNRAVPAVLADVKKFHQQRNEDV